MRADKPAKLKSKPSRSPYLTTEAVAAAAGSSTLARVIHCVEPYTCARPIEPSYHVGALCRDLDFLGVDLNREFGLRGEQQYWKGEIEAEWSTQYLAAYTDLKRKEAP